MTGRQVSVWSSGIRVLLRPAEALPWGRAPGSVCVTAAQDLDSGIGTQVSVGSRVVVGGGCRWDPVSEARWGEPEARGKGLWPRVLLEPCWVAFCPRWSLGLGLVSPPVHCRVLLAGLGLAQGRGSRFIKGQPPPGLQTTACP